MGVSDFLEKNKNVVTGAGLGYMMGGSEGAMMGGMMGGMLLKARHRTYQKRYPNATPFSVPHRQMAAVRTYKK
jgi:predicted Rossmann-fold nucleotide-binding protein